LDCRRSPPSYSFGVVWGSYEGVLRTAILGLKNRGREELAAPLGELLAGRVSVEPWAPEIDLVTWVPSHPLRRLARGHAASASLAESIARRLGLPIVSTLRRHGLGRQATRSRVQRLALGSRSFSSRARRTFGRRILLVDDVTTTGTTLRRAAEALVEGGSTMVACAILARTPEPRSIA
jgi:predicted amidophosphoribosyltransferase